ncbi:MAG: hypothetical protein QNI87_08905 [Erythrobacter sp.]|uniref:hypothetical protein n=1 Tax=Erythrobacter sp. TaxID=1042 RepID=UPI0026243D75|nr:hypothetical protein [Erythrobacter sp.]MDJ0978643.1 hypothetical protein [Erythrobacter sp.]
MIERPHFRDHDAFGEHADGSEDGTGGDPSSLRDAVAFWTDETKVEGPSDEAQLEHFLETLEQATANARTEVSTATNPVGRRGAARLRLSVPAGFTAVDRAHSCILLNLSRTGAKIAILDPLREGDGGILRCGSLSVFAIVARREFSLNALRFEEPIGDEDVLAMRRYYETFELRERRKLIETARRWASGDSKDGRAM